MARTKTAQQRAHRPIIGRPTKWAQMTAEQRDVACEALRNKDWFRCDVPDNDTLEETFRRVLEEKFGFTGLDDWQFYYSLGSCQGDGVAFTGDINVEALAFKHTELMKYVGPIILGKYDCRFVCWVKQLPGSHYSHWNSMDVTCEAQHEYEHECLAMVHHNVIPPADSSRCRACKMDEWACDIQGVIHEIVKDASRACERAGYDVIDDTRSDEYIGDMIAGNDWQFTFDDEGGCEWV